MNFSFALAAFILLSTSFASAQSSGTTLMSITLNSGTSVLGEVRSENAVTAQVFDLTTGDEKSIKLADIKARTSATDSTAILRVGLPRFLAWRVKKELNGPATGKIAEVTPSSIYLTMGSKDGIEVGNTFAVFRDEGELKDPDSGDVIGRKRAKLARLEITEVQDSYSKAKRIGDTDIELKAKDEVEQEGVNLAVAILPILDIEGDEITAGKTLAEQLSTVFVSRGITVVERERLNLALAELALQQNKAFDPAAAQRIGKQLGAVAVLTGTITPKGTRAEAHVRLIRVQTGEAVVAASQDLAAVGNKTAAASSSGANTPSGTTAKNPKGAFTQQFTFVSEKEIKANWQINAPDNLWSIVNNSLKFYTPLGFPTANIDLRYKLHGDVAVEVIGSMDNNSELTVHIFGEKIVVKGNYRVQLLRQGTSLKVNKNGAFSIIQIKESWGNEPTGVKISWRVLGNAPGSCYISSVGIRAAKAEQDMLDQ
jgi:TolB-like protein